MVMESQTLFSAENRVAPLGIISLAGAQELSKKVEAHLVRWAKLAGLDYDTFLIESSCPRFSSGDGKGMINSTVRGYDLFFIVDVGNYSLTYNYFGQENRMSPDDHYQDLKRLIQAASGKAHRMNVVMPLLYGGRQHRRSYRESLDCAYMLQELQHMGVSNLLTFDAHDPRVQNAVPVMGFDNLMPEYQVLKKLFKDFPDLSTDKNDFMIVSPDEGALNRNMHYASVLGVELGMFYKRRDYSRIVDGRNPIVAHEYLGASVEGKDVFVADDIISSGESVLDIAENVKERRANRFFAYATYAIFTNGLEKFDKAYEQGLIDGIFGSNLTYLKPELRNRPWFHEVDVSKYIAYFISALNHDVSISSLLDPHSKIEALLKKRALERAKYADEQLSL
ncbi:MAG: ribose-phosphate pyrophosphokinase [Acutalibacteraceae bacterium]|nr:ribose-phosphate pyrophosphokinase [Acutalibacteraceae bacterium]